MKLGGTALTHGRHSDSASPPGVAIHIRDLVVGRGKKEVLHSLSVDIHAGRIIGLLGPSGCGKTTLMRSIVGAQIIKSGTVTVLRHQAGTTSLRREVAYVTQSASVYDDITVFQNLAYFRRILGAGSGDIERVLDGADLRQIAGRRVGSLSGGQRSRVGLAAAMLGNPKVLVLDEPTVGLDPVLRVQLWQIFRRLADAGATLFVSSHVMDEATRCDELILMRDGSILANGTLAEILALSDADDIEEAFLRLVKLRPDTDDPVDPVDPGEVGALHMRRGRAK